jgi:hypothetical protein
MRAASFIHQILLTDIRYRSSQICAKTDGDELATLDLGNQIKTYNDNSTYNASLQFETSENNIETINIDHVADSLFRSFLHVEKQAKVEVTTSGSDKTFEKIVYDQKDIESALSDIAAIFGEFYMGNKEQWICTKIIEVIRFASDDDGKAAAAAPKPAAASSSSSSSSATSN